MPISIDENIAKQAKDLGFEIPITDPPQETAGVFEVLPSNWKSVCTFLDCETQWRVVATMAGLVWFGLDYTAVDVELKRSGADDAVYSDLKVMERVALKVFSEAKE
ncbi:MAG: DUF1799 domain-containing protein [Pseudoruegeria sp.]